MTDLNTERHRQSLSCKYETELNSDKSLVSASEMHLKAPLNSGTATPRRNNTAKQRCSYVKLKQQYV
ncbi:hypothetical protein A0256_15480 [Mucilaginibacter sp. PAMC 26640]|nr:hypothetical protein A0256_15480 [Mucilaginibacter sp. PAMC 26640]